MKALAKNSKTHYCALSTEELPSLGSVHISLIPTKASHQSFPRPKLLPPEHKSILKLSKEILLLLMEVFGDVQNGNNKRKGKSKAFCSSYSTDRHGLTRHDKGHDDLLFFVPFESTFLKVEKEKHTDNPL